VHWAPHGEIDVTQLQPDFLLCSAYKFFGPHVGVLYAKPGLLDSLPTLKVRPQDEHGPARIETGTLNHAALAGVSAAVDFIASLSETPADPLRLRLTSAMRAIYHYEHELAQGLYQGLSGIDGVRVWGPPVGQADRAPTVSFTLAGRTAGEVAAYLGHQGILAWDGDFYAVGAVDALGLREQGGLVRLGLAPYNTAQEVARTLDAVATLSRS
jgi:selenocysteine lyase/cysteine desulfurase